MMRFLAIALRMLAAICRLLPRKRQVALLSRQIGKMSTDFRLLKAELDQLVGPEHVRVHIMKPEMAGKVAFLAGTIAQVGIASRSSVVVADGYLPAVCIPPKREGCTVIQMWHAPGAIKKFGYQCLDTPAGRTTQAAREAHMHENYDWIIAGGTGAIGAYAQAFRYPEQAIAALGLPHFDYLLDTSPQGERLQRAVQIASENPFLADALAERDGVAHDKTARDKAVRDEAAHDGKLTILYAPTLRKGDGYDGWLSAYVQALVEQCPPERAQLVVAGHPLDHNMDATLYERYPNLHYVPRAATIDLLEFADCVISDYSTVALSAGLLGKPVLYYVPDIERYSASPGLNVNLLEDPRLSASTNAELLMRTALDDVSREQAAQRHQTFIDEYFANEREGAAYRVAQFVAGKI